MLCFTNFVPNCWCLLTSFIWRNHFPLDLPPDLKFWIIFCKMVRRLFPFFSARVETGQGNGSYRDPFHGARTDSTIEHSHLVDALYLYNVILNYIQALFSVQGLIKCKEVISTISTTTCVDSTFFAHADLWMFVMYVNMKTCVHILQSV